MWIIYEDIEHRTDLEAKKGTKYSGWVLTGTKKGYMEEGDTPYSKVIFDNATATVIDANGEAEMLLYEFFQSCTPGDLIDMKFVQDGMFKRINSVENKNRSVLPENTGSNNTPSNAVGDGDNLTTAAVVFVNALITNGHYEEKTSPEVLLDAVATYRMRLSTIEDVNPFSDNADYSFEEMSD